MKPKYSINEVVKVVNWHGGSAIEDQMINNHYSMVEYIVVGDEYTNYYILQDAPYVFKETELESWAPGQDQICKMAKYRKGDKVKVLDGRGTHQAGRLNWAGEMTDYIGKTGTIRLTSYNTALRPEPAYLLDFSGKPNSKNYGWIYAEQWLERDENNKQKLFKDQLALADSIGDFHGILPLGAVDAAFNMVDRFTPFKDLKDANGKKYID